MTTNPATAPSSSAQWTARLLAITGPLFALVIAINVFVQPPEKMLSEAALHMETKLAEEKPDVILLGNSMARLGVNEKQLSKILNAKVMNLSVDGSSARACGTSCSKTGCLPMDTGPTL